ncbi:hypothetical protein QP794_29010 [Paenibacillus sp. UMB7766-LJ446]|nr:hypothetical protein [Paenibacillus sp. UMB7766-LJ446]MDK8194121.1 hypothetical protein [Paenibacillus sp. UMB7766-LJ446]
MDTIVFQFLSECVASSVDQVQVKNIHSQVKHKNALFLLKTGLGR